MIRVVAENFTSFSVQFGRHGLKFTTLYVR